MLNDWGAMTRDYSAQLRDVRAGIPDVMKGFSATAQAALKAKALDTKTRAAGAAQCRGDPLRPVHRLSRRSRGQAGRIAGGGTRNRRPPIYMGAGPSVMYAAKALEAFDQFSPPPKAA